MVEKEDHPLSTFKLVDEVDHVVDEALSFVRLLVLNYPCRKDAHRMECGRSADQAQRCDGGHKCQPYASRAVVPWSRDPEELAAKFRLILG